MGGGLMIQGIASKPKKRRKLATKVPKKAPARKILVVTHGGWVQELLNVLDRFFHGKKEGKA